MLKALNLASADGQRLQPLSVELEQGEVIHLIGANGSGKTTLLSLLSGLYPYQGELYLDKLPVNKLSIHQLACQRAYLIQQQKPAFNMRVYQYLQLCMHAYNAFSSLHTNDEDICDICQQLNIKDKLERLITELSGGEWQRVRLAGVWLQISNKLNSQGKLLLLDEPATGLDIAQQIHLSNMIKTLSKEGITVVMSSHDINQSIAEAHKVMVLKKGRCIGFGVPMDILIPKLLYTAFEMQLKRIEIDGRVFILPC